MADTLRWIGRDVPNAVPVLQALECSPAYDPLHKIVLDRRARHMTHADAVREVATLYAEHCRISSTCAAQFGKPDAGGQASARPGPHRPDLWPLPHR